MGLVLTYVQKLPSGRYRYRRRVPGPLIGALGKRVVHRSLGSSKQDAFARYPSVHGAVNRQFLAAARKLVPPVAPPSLPTELLAYRAMLERLGQMGVDTASTPSYADPETDGDRGYRQQLAEAIIDGYPVDPVSGEAVGVSVSDAWLARALNNGVPNAPPPTLSDATSLYLTERVTGADAAAHAKRLRVGRVIRHAQRALGGDRKLTEIRRGEARSVRDYLRDSLGVGPATAKRYLIDVRAIVNLGIREHELGIADPFAGITVEVSGLRRNDRRSFTDEEFDAASAQIEASASLALRRIWKLLSFTGCRVSEISGLRTSDVALAGQDYPHVRIRTHEMRRLKTQSSERDVPLADAALSAVRDAVLEAGASPSLFPTYAGDRGGDRVSAALMRHVRAVIADKEVTNHSLRHRLKDKMGIAGVQSDAQEMILGHASDGVKATYGGGPARLRIMAEALAKTFPS